MNKEKEFTKNTIILLLGKFSTQFISFLLIPLYTRKLTTSDYGYVDLVQTYITLFVPILTLKMDSVAFRFLVEARENKGRQKEIITNIVYIMIISLLITVFLSILALFFLKIDYISFITTNIIILLISNVFLQFLRGLGRNKEYALYSLLVSIITIVSNIILIVFFNFGANSILISASISNAILIIIIAKKLQLVRLIDKNLINKREMKVFFKYAIPMIPNQLSWWIVNASDRTIISYFIGMSYNGIYTISCKFSNIINSIFNIVGMSWQETICLHINDKNRDEFISNMFNVVFNLFSTLSLLIIAVLPFLFDFIIGSEYVDSYRYIPILLLANIYYIIIGLIGGIYVGLKKVKEIANTTIVSAIINIVINIILITRIQLYAAVYSTLIAYISMFIYRYIDVKKYVKIELNKYFFVLINLIFVLTSITYRIRYYVIDVSIFIFIILYSLLSNRSIIKKALYCSKKKYIDYKNRKIRKKI